MKRLAPFLALLFLADAAAAHDFWLETTSWRPTLPAAIRITPLIGDATKREPWSLRSERIVTLAVLGPLGWRDAQAGIVPGEPGHADITLAEAGTHVIVLSSTPSASDLPAADFNAYIKHEGLTQIATWRATHGQTASNGRELYARRAKILVQVGAPATPNATVQVGQTLEIVPVENPFALAPEAPVSVRVLFRGKPLVGAQVELESLSGASPASVVITDSSGSASFPLPKRGAWKITCVWSVPIANDARADFDTLFSSLSFGF